MTQKGQNNHFNVKLLKDMIERKVDLNADRKRLWFEELSDFNEQRLIDSLQISLNLFEVN